jgi:hypothetical protein
MRERAVLALLRFVGDSADLAREEFRDFAPIF